MTSARAVEISRWDAMAGTSERTNMDSIAHTLVLVRHGQSVACVPSLAMEARGAAGSEHASS